MHRHFATVCSRIMQFSPKCSVKITVYQAMQNLYQLVKYSLINRQNWIHVMSDVTLHANFVADFLQAKCNFTWKIAVLQF